MAEYRETRGSGLVRKAEESEYLKRRHDRVLSPDRGGLSYAEVMEGQQLDREKQRLMDQLKKNKVATPPVAKKRKRWGETPVGAGVTDETPVSADLTDETPVGRTRKTRWDETPAIQGSSGVSSLKQNMGWAGSGSGSSVPGKKRSRWDVTPAGSTNSVVALQTPRQNLSVEQKIHLRYDMEVTMRNRPLTDDDLDAMFPPMGYKILEPPASYMPIRTPLRKLMATPTPMMGSLGFKMAGPGETPGREAFGILAGNLDGTDGDMPVIRPEDAQYFGKLMENENLSELSSEEVKERKIMLFLLKIKNGTSFQRKAAMRGITDKARELGAGPLFNQILPLLMSPSLEDQERHLLVKVVDRVLYKLDDLVRPFVHKILVVIEPLLIDQDYYARVEGREIISNLSKAAGLATMIATMRPDIDHVDEFVRNTTARTFSVVASALGIPALLPFLFAVCNSRKSWQARHTGCKIVQQIASRPAEEAEEERGNIVTQAKFCVLEFVLVLEISCLTS